MQQRHDQTRRRRYRPGVAWSERRVSLSEILVLVGGACLPAPAVPASTRIYARLKQFTREYPARGTISEIGFGWWKYWGVLS